MKNLNNDNEVVVTSAVKVTYEEDGIVKDEVFLGVRHHSALQNTYCYNLRKEKNVINITEGFVTNKLDETGRNYRFVTREEAWDIVLNSNQRRKQNPSVIEGVLFSEDLY